MLTVVAPKYYSYTSSEIKVFLAGGITNCAEWQDEVIEKLRNIDTPMNAIIFNPRRKDFDVSNPKASEEQIYWEFNYLNAMDIFSMYFVNSNSVQPICFYELGRHLERMKKRFPNDYLERIVIGVEDGFSRTNDVLIQTKLALGKDIVCWKATPSSHAYCIKEACKFVNENKVK